MSLELYRFIVLRTGCNTSTVVPSSDNAIVELKNRRDHHCTYQQGGFYCTIFFASCLGY